MYIWFIKALSGGSQALSISRNQLDSYTKDVIAYRLVNVFHDAQRPQPIYLIDSPGFSDSKISELEIMNSVKAWLECNSILYLVPVTDTRLPGSKRRTISMLKEFLKPTYSLGYITFVTTMCDTVCNDRLSQRALTNYRQLENEILKDFIHGGSTITKFVNSKRSALGILFQRVYVHQHFGTPVNVRTSVVALEDMGVRLQIGTALTLCCRYLDAGHKPPAMV
ncbi:hypothetical protein BJ165DRAFT_1404789 [Panaeolus papilionaceus]|nr:hypothetical protein BJ165DRAFT_1404789 [Panaeolus papilionaceus]